MCMKNEKMLSSFVSVVQMPQFFQYKERWSCNAILLRINGDDFLPD